MNDLFNDLAANAHEAVTTPAGFASGDVAMHFVDELKRLEGSGSHEIKAFLDRLMVAGASKWLASWRRRNLIPAKTARGKKCELPQHAGVIGEDGKYMQLPLMGMDVDTLRKHMEKLERHRNTLSIEITVLRDLITAMESNPNLRTVGDAFRKLGLAA